MNHNAVIFKIWCPKAKFHHEGDLNWVKFVFWCIFAHFLKFTRKALTRGRTDHISTTVSQSSFLSQLQVIPQRSPAVYTFTAWTALVINSYCCCFIMRPWTLTLDLCLELGIDMAKTKQQVKYLGQRSFRWIVIVRTHKPHFRWPNRACLVCVS